MAWESLRYAAAVPLLRRYCAAAALLKNKVKKMQKNPSRIKYMGLPLNQLRRATSRKRKTL